MSITRSASALSTISELPTFSLRTIVKPLCRSACAYSWPRMYSSVKFLVARRIAGLPLPGSAAVAPEPPLEPQPVRASMNAASAMAANFMLPILTGSLGRHHLGCAFGHRAQRRAERLGRLRDRQLDVDHQHVEAL